MNLKTPLLILGLITIASLGLGVFNAIQIKTLNANLIYLRERIENPSEGSTTVNTIEEFKKKLDNIQLPKGTVAPAFELKNQDGELISLKNLRKPQALLIFTSAYCDTCKEFYPHVNRFLLAKPQNLDLIVIQMDGNQIENKSLLEEENYNFMILNATGTSTFDDYHIVSTPTSILVDTKSQEIIRTGDLFDYSDIVAFTDK